MVSIMSDTRVLKTPWHLWLIGVVAVLWNSIGAYDYVMTMYGGMDYLRQAGMTEAFVAEFQKMPVWMSVAWPVAVWSAVAGSVLLLARSRWAFPAFAVSLIVYLSNLVHNYGMSELGALGGTAGRVIAVTIAISLVILAGYSRMMAKRGVLR
ncbi:MAG: hypothetical protein Q8S03_15390 [Brevundimonas sp.]|uniref:hypothetical protein n=1 Tax=Brevundimonas sp. TaxID=1871086 RepID=UPI0027368577|nr:hypothetical protein [Brevundimonas sp.]MDP3406071.1 hypothetical protein [Brevundimonas sp.]